MDKPVDQTKLNNSSTGSTDININIGNNDNNNGKPHDNNDLNISINHNDSDIKPVLVLRSAEAINNDIEAQKSNAAYLTAKANVHARRATIGADLSGAVQGASWATTSLLVFVDKWRHFLDQRPLTQAAGIYLLPVAVLAQGFEMMFDWAAFRNQKNAGQTGWKATLAKAITNTLSFAAMATATIGGLAFAAVFAVAAPALMTAALAAKSVYHFGAAMYYQYKASQLTKSNGNLKEIEHYQHSRDDNAIRGVSTGLVAIAFGLVSFLSNPVFAILGVIGGAISVAMGLGNAWANHTAKVGSRFEYKVHPTVLSNAVVHNNTHQNGKMFLNTLHQERAAAMAVEKQAAQVNLAPAVNSINLTVEPKKGFWATRCAKNDKSTVDVTIDIEQPKEESVNRRTM